MDAERAVEAAEKIIAPDEEPILLRVPLWPRTGLEDWTFFAAGLVEPKDEPAFEAPAAYRSRLLSEHEGIVYVVHMSITPAMIEENAQNLLTFMSRMIHEAHEEIAEAIEARKAGDGEN